MPTPSPATVAARVAAILATDGPQRHSDLSRRLSPPQRRVLPEVLDSGAFAVSMPPTGGRVISLRGSGR